jgi:UDP-glucose 4-epimerase
MAVLITGVAGFIGSNLAHKLIAKGQKVLGVDNLSRGKIDFIKALSPNPAFKFLHGDINDKSAFYSFVKSCAQEEKITEVWHLAANSDIPNGVKDANIDLRDTFMTTFNVLEAMKEFGIKVIHFASSSAIYGDLNGKMLKEDIGPLCPISNYGAMKLASEAIICAASESHLEKVYIYRFPNVIGTPATHGVIVDLIRKLRMNPNELEVLGDGSQRKAYLHVDDLILAMHFISERSEGKINIFNIGAGDTGVFVRDLAQEVVRVVSPKAKIKFGTSNKGWVGDVPEFQYSIDRLKGLGWQLDLNSMDAVKRSIREIAAQEGAQ